MLLALNLLIFNVSSQSNGTSMLQYFEKHSSDTDKKRPTIHTFLYGETPKESLEKDELIRIWAEAWADAGWNPIILTEKDAMYHPQYDQHVNQLKNAKLPEYRWNRFLRYVAMSQQGGGWYSEPYVLPIRADLF